MLKNGSAVPHFEEFRNKKVCRDLTFPIACLGHFQQFVNFKDTFQTWVICAHMCGATWVHLLFLFKLTKRYRCQSPKFSPENGRRPLLLQAVDIDETTNRDVKDSILDAARSQRQWVYWQHGQTSSHRILSKHKNTSQELRMLSSVTINCQVTKIVINPGSQLSVS